MHYDLQIEVQEPFGNLFRERCVLVAVQTEDGKILLGAKDNFYPPTIQRLLGGGVDANETFEKAAMRELREELGVQTDSFAPIAHFKVRARDAQGNHYANTTAVFSAHIGDTPYQAGDDVTRIITATPEQIYKLSERYSRLPHTLWHKDRLGTYAWADYAKMYGPIHKIVAEQLLERLA